MENKLIFGKDQTPGIVNITLKDDTVFLYKQTANGIELEQFPYTPWCLSPKKLTPDSQLLKGDQFYRYITSLSTDKFLELNEHYQRNVWLPRSIEECVTLCEGLTYYKGMKANEVSILSFDIESSGLVMDDTSKVFLISNTFRNGDNVVRKLFSIDRYEHQVDMILDWCEWVRQVDPSIITGHNILSYDLPYLQYCLALDDFDGLTLGRDGSYAEFATKTSKFRKDGSQQYDYHNVRITGREIVDTFFLSIKYDIARDFPSYGLKPIIKHLKLDKSDRQYYDAARIKDNWSDLGEREKIKQYAIDDSDDALKLFDIMIPAYFYLAQSVPSTLQQIVNTATGSQINNFLIRSYLQDGYSIAQADRITEHLEGGISFGVPGLYKNMMKIDLKSAYPSQVLRFNLYDKRKDPYGYFYEMVKYFTLERFELKDLYRDTKDQHYKDREQTAKVFINSAYGACSTNYLNYNSPKLAAQITEATREMINMSLLWASGEDKNYWLTLFEEKTA